MRFRIEGYDPFPPRCFPHGRFRGHPYQIVVRASVCLGCVHGYSQQNTFHGAETVPLSERERSHKKVVVHRPPNKLCGLQQIRS
jgi:hypothetical protein